MTVRLLTIEQKDKLVGQLFDEDSFFNPIQDLNDNWIISNEEADQCVNADFVWVKNLPEIDFLPKSPPSFKL